MATYSHMRMDIKGFLKSARFPKDFTSFDNEGKRLKPAEAQNMLFDKLIAGERFLPMSPNCKEFDPQKGCPGHPVEEKE